MRQRNFFLALAIVVLVAGANSLFDGGVSDAQAGTITCQGEANCVRCRSVLQGLKKICSTSPRGGCWCSDDSGECEDDARSSPCYNI